MQLADALAKIAPHRDAIRARKVKSLAIFGSTARGEARTDSDIDILVEFSDIVGLFHFFELRDFLEQILGARVDLVSRNGLKPAVRERIEREAVNAA